MLTKSPMPYVFSLLFVEVSLVTRTLLHMTIRAIERLQGVKLRIAIIPKGRKITWKPLKGGIGVGTGETRDPSPNPPKNMPK